MRRHSIVYVLVGWLFALFGCATDNPAPLSVDTVETEVQLRPVAPGVSEGEYGNQHVVYVTNKQGAQWLLESTQQQHGDAVEHQVVPRLEVNNVVDVRRRGALGVARVTQT